MTSPQNTIALVFDFDDTLTEDSTTLLLEKHGVDTKEFWNKKVKSRVENGWDPSLAYLDLLLELAGPDKPLGNLSNKGLREFGSKLDFYPGIPELFTSLKKDLEAHELSNPRIEYYIVSGGLEEIIRGSKIASFFSGIWGCRFEEEGGRITKVNNVVTFTEKTKFLFLINKGLHKKHRDNPYLVNEFVAPENRRIPFQNMIYIGDGLTDVPCFSLLQKANGHPFGVFHPKKTGSPKKAWEKLIAPKRVVNVSSPSYGEEDDLGALIRVAVREICFRLDANSRAAI